MNERKLDLNFDLKVWRVAISRRFSWSENGDISRTIFHTNAALVNSTATSDFQTLQSPS